MATRSFKGLLRKTEGGLVVDFTYTHLDGYPSWLGKILVEHYSDLNRLKELLSLGDTSVLYPALYPSEVEGCEKHSFDTPCDGVTIFYGRDRGEDNVNMKTLTWKEFLDTAKESGAEFLYVAVPDPYDSSKVLWYVIPTYDIEETYPNRDSKTFNLRAYMTYRLTKKRIYIEPIPVETL